MIYYDIHCTPTMLCVRHGYRRGMIIAQKGVLKISRKSADRKSMYDQEISTDLHTDPLCSPCAVINP